jgi:hypothetical protein
MSMALRRITRTALSWESNVSLTASSTARTRVVGSSPVAPSTSSTVGKSRSKNTSVTRTSAEAKYRYAVVFGHYRGRHDGELMGVPATGNDVDFTVMHVDRVQDGRIVEHRGIGDINAMWAQLAVKPPD